MGYWFAGRADSAWRPDHKKCEEFLNKIASGEAELGRRWSMFPALSHPTKYAAESSTALVVSRVTGRGKFENVAATMEPKIADYLASVSSLIVAATLDIPHWIPLKCDPGRMHHVDAFHAEVAKVVPPVLDKTKNASLPKGSFRG